MNRFTRTPVVRLCAMALAGAPLHGALADPATPLTTITISALRLPLDPNLPASSEGLDAEQLRVRNVVDVEDALKHMPDVTIRKRYIGDRNALVGGRSSSELQTARALVYADGYLLSQFLGQYNAPRWNVVAPEELARVDVVYGPFSALYPGNSIGTTVLMTSRRPQRFEGSARVQLFSQSYADAGYSGTYRGRQESAWLGNRAGPWSMSIGVNRLSNDSQPMQYLVLQPSKSTAAATAVTGAAALRDPTGKPMLLAGPASGALEQATQQQVKLKLGYDFSPSWYGEAMALWWDNDARRAGASTLRDAAGHAVESGLVSVDGARYSIPANAFAPQTAQEGHAMLGLKLATKKRVGWSGSAVASLYDIGRDTTRSSAGAPSLANSPGTYADNSGTGWTALDLQANYLPAQRDDHTLVLGLHDDRYRLKNRSYATTDWRYGAPQGQLSAFYGNSGAGALFAQDSFAVAPGLRATLGLRYERWAADGGRRETAAFGVDYAASEVTAWSPKASLSYRAGNDWTLRASAGKGVRFPTVSELFQGSVVGASIVNNNPGLRPERARSKELAAEREFGAGSLRIALFEDDVRDTIYSQTNVLLFPQVSNIQNIDRVRTRGAEFSASASDVLVSGLDLNGNLSLSRSLILEDAANPALAGKRWVRVPCLRANLVASYRAGERWNASLALRRSGRQFSNLDNSDINPDTYGGTSSYTSADIKLGYRLAPGLEASLGINNLGNRHYFVFHPYPGRSLIGELRANF
jgi:iron complex outermembrane receptor protein